MILNAKYIADGVSFDGVFTKIIDISFDSIGVFQELCKECCLAAGLQEKSKSLVVIDDNCLEVAIKNKLDDYSGRHIRSLETFLEILMVMHRLLAAAEHDR